jgi:hypothetical protein
LEPRFPFCKRVLREYYEFFLCARRLECPYQSLCSAAKGLSAQRGAGPAGGGGGRAALFSTALRGVFCTLTALQAQILDQILAPES